MKYIFEGSQDLCIVKLCVQFVSMFLKVTFHPLTHPPSPQNFFSPEIFQSRDLKTPNVCVSHEITKYGIHSFTQITLAVDNELTYGQDSAPDWLNKSSRQLVICIYRQ